MIRRETVEVYLVVWCDQRCKQLKFCSGKRYNSICNKHGWRAYSCWTRPLQPAAVSICHKIPYHHYQMPVMQLPLITIITHLVRIYPTIHRWFCEVTFGSLVFCIQFIKRKNKMMLCIIQSIAAYCCIHLHIHEENKFLHTTFSNEQSLIYNFLRRHIVDMWVIHPICSCLSLRFWKILTNVHFSGY